ncbi:MAG: GNAT family N-acetyltransferase, partial [Bdellovibrionales bacterium]|nr:GNAT family N-acetyltransferase [Bdellovibrionales bacterium]
MIEDECQGQGLGSLLLQALEQEASDRQIKV